MAIQQCSYAFTKRSARDDDSSSEAFTPPKKSSYCRVQVAKMSSREPDYKESSKLPFVTRSSATGLVTISVSLIGERRMKKPPVSLVDKNVSFLPPIQSNHRRTKKISKKKVIFQPRKPVVNNNKCVATKQTEKSAQPKRNLTRTFTVHFFPQETIQVAIERNSKLKNSSITYAQVKYATAVSLRIEPTSLNFFGIFLGPLGNPKELCIDDAAIPDSIHEVCFQRLVLISEEEERFYLSKDDRALGLIFWELKDQYDRSQVFPIPSREKSIELERLLSCSNFSISVKKRFVDLLLGVPSFYWSYYHKANYCMLQNSIWPNDYTTCKGTVVHVVPGRKELIFLDISRDVEIESFPWHRVRSLTLKTVPVMSIDFEIVLVTKNQCLSHFISVITDCNKFLYSISIFMLRILQSQDMNDKILPALDPHIADYIKIQAEPTGSTKQIILYSGEATAIAFDRIDLTDSKTDKKFRNRYCFRGPVYFKSKNCFSFWEPYSDSSSDEEECSRRNHDSHDEISGEKETDISTSDIESIDHNNMNDTTINPCTPICDTFNNQSEFDQTKLEQDSQDERSSSEGSIDLEFNNSADDELTDDELKTNQYLLQDEDDDVFYSGDEELPDMSGNMRPWM